MFPSPGKRPLALVYSYSHPSLRQPLICFLSLLICSLDISYKWNQSTWSFYVWLLLHMSLRFTHVVSCISNSFLLTAKYYFIVWIHCVLLSHSPADGHSGFHFGHCEWCCSQRPHVRLCGGMCVHFGG